jgi:hypothetical protein
MVVSAALTLVLSLAPAAEPGRILLCRPRIAGDAALARGEAIAQAGKAVGRFLDYGVVCEDPAEAARAARRVGLAHAVSSVAEGKVGGSQYTLVLSDAGSESLRARRTLDVVPGADATGPLRVALTELLGAIPAPRSAISYTRVAQWTLVGAGAVAIAAGTYYAARARSAASDADAATDPASYTHARAAWRDRRTASGVLLGVGAAAVAGGLTWRYAF